MPSLKALAGQKAKVEKVPKVSVLHYQVLHRGHEVKKFLFKAKETMAEFLYLFDTDNFPIIIASDLVR